jgi:hypothetical protein
MDCFNTKPRCRQCDAPMALPAGYNAEPNSSGLICATCSQSQRGSSKQTCLACGKSLKDQRSPGQYVEFDGVGPYCMDCYRNRQPCDVCGAPLTNEQWQLSDGRITCAHCHAAAIYTPDTALALYEEMKQLVAGRLGLQLNIPTGLALVDRNQLREVIRQQTAPLAGSPVDVGVAGSAVPGYSSEGGIGNPAAADTIEPLRTLGLYARRGMRRGIYIQTGLPRMLFLQVAAHEYAHAWQGENCPMLFIGSTPAHTLAHEGFAEWLAYRVIGEYGYARGQAKMLARQDIYGNGLRWALDIESRQGTAALFETLRTMQG